MNSSAVFNITHHIKYVNLPEKFARFLISQKKTIQKKNNTALTSNLLCIYDPHQD